MKIKHLTCWLLLGLAITFFACESKEKTVDTSKTVTEVKAQSKTDIKKDDLIKKCAFLQPPWGDMEWREWWQKNPEEAELWFVETPKKMKKADLSIIPKCKHITDMFVGFAPLKDLTLFSSLTQLKRLDIRYIKDVSDLTPLRNLKNLEELNIWSTAVSDLKPLIGLNKLRSINARMTKISDLSPLVKLPALESIDLLQAPVKDISVLAKIDKIKEILTCSTQVSDLSPLYPVAERITYLDLCNCPFKDFQELKRFKNLEILKLWGLPIGDLNQISSLSKLKTLDLSGTSFKSLKPLYTLKNLEEVWVANIKIDQKELDQLKKSIPKAKIVTKF